MVGLVTKSLKDGAGNPFTAYFYDDGTALAPATALWDYGAGSLVGYTATSPTYPKPTTAISGATASMTGTADTLLLAAPGAGLNNYVTCIIISNSHASVGTDVVIKDGLAGTVLMTIPAAFAYGGAVITLPTPLKQPTANTALYVANLTTGAAVKASAVGYKE